MSKNQNVWNVKAIIAMNLRKIKFFFQFQLSLSRSVSPVNKIQSLSIEYNKVAKP